MKYLSDVLIILGCVAITASAAFVHPALALFVGGLFCFLGGIALDALRWASKRGEP